MGSGAPSLTRRRAVEWPTLAVLAGCYAAWGLCLFGLAGVHPALAMLALVPVLALHSSLSHEALHGHPTRHPVVNAALLFPCLGLFIPYLRFKAQHLEHHRDSILTDPYDDPESNFLDPKVWARLPGWFRALLRFNNTLLGRIVIGPVLGQIAFVQGDWRLIRAGDRAVLAAWALHLVAVLPVLWLVTLSPVPLWAYLLACYGALAVLKIRTFLEHRAHERARGRTVVIEDRGILAFLFLNNNFHVVHHMHPKAPWYELPGLYARNRAHYLRRNEGYRYRSYGEVFRAHFLRAKDPVPHPFLPSE